MKKFFIVIAVFFFAVLVAGQLYVRSDSFALRIRPYVIGPLREILGNQARFGSIRANLVPLYVEARDISLVDQNNREAAAVRKIKVYIDPLPLLLKKVRLPSIVLLEPRIYPERTKDGEFNMAPLVETIKANVNRMRAKGPSGFSVDLRTITVNQGRISFKDNMTGMQASASGVHAVAKVAREGGNISLLLKNAAVHAFTPAYPELAGNLTAAVRFDGGKFHLESLDLRNADSVVSLSGDVGSLPDPELNLRVKARSGAQTIGKFTSLLKYLKKEPRSYIQASASVRGSLSNPSAEGVLTLSGFSYQGLVLQDAALSFNYRNKHLDAAGEKWKIARGNKSIAVDSIKAAFGYTERGLDIERFNIQAGDLFLVLSGRADPHRGFDAVLSLDSKDQGQSLSFLTSAPLQGNIRVKGNLTGLVKEPLFDGTFSADPLIVRGISFENAGGRLQYREKKISLVSADIHQRASRFLFNGSVDLSQKEPVLAAKLKVIGSDVGTVVALFYKPLPLHFSATGDLAFNGTLADFTGSGRLAFESGSAYGESFTKGTITAALTKDKIAFPEVVIEKGSGTITGTGWIGFDQTYSAAIESHGVKLAEVNHLAGIPADGLFDLTIESSGSFSRPQVTASLEVEEFFFNQAAFGGLTAGLQIGEKVLLCKAELADGRAGLTGRLGLSKPYGWSIQMAMNADMQDPFLIAGNKELSGRTKLAVEGALSLRGAGADISALSGNASFDRLEFAVGDYRLDNEGPASVSIRGDRFSIASLNLTGQSTRIGVTGGGRFMKEVDVEVTGTANLSLLRPLVEEVEHSDGTAEVSLAVTDSWKNPEVAGELQLKNGEVKLKDIPQKFSGLTGKITFDKRRLVVDSLTGQIGGGSMTASGKAQLAGLAIQDFSSRVVFENVTVRFPEGLTSTLSGELYYDGDVSEQSMTGDVLIKRAHYDKRVEWKSMLVDIGKGLYQKKKTEAGWIGDTQINIRFYGKDNILFQNNLAKMPLDVDVFLRGTVNRPQILGRIEARKGSVYFRQNEFKILYGSADFVDPNRMNPVLDIQAQIQVREHLIRLAVSGTSDRAIVTLLSDPPLPDSDILALLALGKTGEQLKGKEQGVGISEAASFATGQFQDIFESRARNLTGLDRFQVDPYVSKGDTSVPRVTVGKEIMQDKLYVTYSSNVGATTPEQIFRIEYILNRHFSLVGERNELGNTGADIKYRFEFK